MFDVGVIYCYRLSSPFPSHFSIYFSLRFSYRFIPFYPKLSPNWGSIWEFQSHNSGLADKFAIFFSFGIAIELHNGGLDSLLWEFSVLLFNFLILSFTKEKLAWSSENFSIQLHLSPIPALDTKYNTRAHRKTVVLF
jgi:hypothetical protein